MTPVDVELIKKKKPITRIFEELVTLGPTKMTYDDFKNYIGVTPDGKAF